MQFQVIDRNANFPSEINRAYLKIDLWNDYSFITMFFLCYRDGAGNLHEIGQTKICFKGQTTETPTYRAIPSVFESLGEAYFSVGQDVDFYKNLASFPEEIRSGISAGLRDVVANPEIISAVEDEQVYATSLLRYVSLSAIRNQFSRVLDGYPELTDYSFAFEKPADGEFETIRLEFFVKESSTPSTNIHAIIGRNGVGKTTLLNGMIRAISGQHGCGQFLDISRWGGAEVRADYFSCLISVSFSAFDPFVPPAEQSDPSSGTRYYYVGLKDPNDSDRLKTLTELRRECSAALMECFSNDRKAEAWTRAISRLSSDEIFSSMELGRLLNAYHELRRAGQGDLGSSFAGMAAPFLEKMSSGHAVVLLTITRLVARVEEKTLILLDEPESHLHPPLLAAFIRALSDLLYERNGVAIVATHSPVVLQEIPRSCVWKVYRYGGSFSYEKPAIETFGENVGLLTSEVFGLEVERSGFYELLARACANGDSFEQIVSTYGGQLGFEGRAVLATLVSERGRV